MKHHTSVLPHSRQCAQQFLLNQPETDALRKRPSCGVSEIYPALPLKTCPHMSKSVPLEAMIAGMAREKRFGAMMVQFDAPDDERQETEVDACCLRLGQVLEDLCRDMGGLWAPTADQRHAVFLPGADAATCKQAAERLHLKFSASGKATISTGIAVYPEINFHPNQILTNAAKALDHAHFFGADSSVRFDAVSLNISGDNCYQNGDIHGAIREFRLGLKLDPTSANLHNSLGVCHGLLGEHAQALQAFETALWLEPKEVMAAYNISIIHLLQGERDKALEQLLAASQLDADIFEVAFQIGRLLMEKGCAGEALDHLQRAIALKPDSAPALSCLATCCMDCGQLQEAAANYNRAVKLNPNDAAALSALGHLYDLLDENIEIATLFCEQSVAIQPDCGLYRYRLGLLYFKQNRLEEALSELERASALGHDVQIVLEELYLAMPQAQAS